MIVDQISIDLSIFNLLYFQSIIVLIQVEHYPLIGTTVTNKIPKGEEGLVIHTYLYEDVLGTLEVLSLQMRGSCIYYRKYILYNIYI